MNEEAKSLQDTSIHVTSTLIQMVHEVQQEEHNPSLCLRVGIKGGGCSGFKYDLDLVEDIAEDDWIFRYPVPSEGSKTSEVRVLIDPISFPYLEGATVDYVQDTQGERIVIRNPKAQHTCGCGSSFTPKEEEES